MANDLVALVLRTNAVLAAAIFVVLLLRAPARRLFGARVAYALWLAPLIAAAASFLPARVVHIVIDAPLHGVTPAHAVQPPYLLWAWAAGALISLAVLCLRQFRFTQALGRLRTREDLGARVLAAESATHGPAVIGVLRPIIVTPSDFDARFDADERRIVLAHERAHMAQGDPWINAVVLLLQCLNWFNPLVHIGVRALRIDQELACDAAVLAQAEGARRIYAEAMLKTHLGAAVPIGCAWPSSNLSSFKERIAMLKRTLPSRTQRLMGASAIALVIGAAAAAAWAAQPARIVATVAAVTPLPPDAYTPLYTTASADEDLEGADDALDDLNDLNDLDDTDFVELAELDIDLETARDWDDLSPAEKAQVRAALEQAREAMTEARVEMREAMEHRGLSDADRAEVQEAMREAREAMQNVEIPDHLSAEQQQHVRQALAIASAAMADTRVHIQTQELTRIQVREAMEQAREAMEEARVEIARAAEEARAAGDSDRADALGRAERALEGADENGDEDERDEE